MFRSTVGCDLTGNLGYFFLLNLEIENRAESFQTLEHSKQRNVMNDKLNI